MDSKAIVDTILLYFPEVEAIYLFGSHATADERPESDVDLALLFPYEPKTTADAALCGCRQALENLSKKTTDVIDLGSANTVFQHEIIQEGRILYQQSEQAVDRFEMLVMSKYQKLNEERADILQEVFQNGRIVAS
jgi:uncharacterized protein